MRKNIIAVEQNERECMFLRLEFDVPYRSFDLLGAVRYAVADYCKTEEGKRDLELNHGQFTWNDLHMIPDKICQKYGFKLVDTDTCDDFVYRSEQLV